MKAVTDPKQPMSPQARARLMADAEGLDIVGLKPGQPFDPIGDLDRAIAAREVAEAAKPRRPLRLVEADANSSPVKPYVGAGINYTRISSVNLLDGGADLENDSFGYAIQAGLDYAIDKNWSLNFDVKKVQIRSDVFIGGAKASRVKVDPVLLGVGVGYRF